MPLEQPTGLLHGVDARFGLLNQIRAREDTRGVRIVAGTVDRMRRGECLTRRRAMAHVNPQEIRIIGQKAENITFLACGRLEV